MRFPLFIELEGRSVIVIGGGAIGTRRACAMAEYGAEVTVIVPEISEPLREMAENGTDLLEAKTGGGQGS